MQQRIKYVISENFLPVLFSDAIRHDQFKSLHPTSAGFVHIDGLIVITYGESVSLCLKPHDRDSKLIRDFIAGGQF